MLTSTNSSLSTAVCQQQSVNSHAGVRADCWHQAFSQHPSRSKCAVAESDSEAAEEAKKYSTFWKEFGKAIKLGIIEDVQNRQRLAKLLRFETSKSAGKTIGLDAYIANMKEGQKSIYYLAGVPLLLQLLQQLLQCLVSTPSGRLAGLAIFLTAGAGSISSFP